MNVLVPRTVSEACELLAAHEAAIPIAGGTDLCVHWPLRIEDRDRTFVDLSGLDELRCYRWTEEELVLGALTTYWDIIRDPRAGIELPLLVSAARQVGAIQIQTRGTWAGNIVNASPAADGVAVLMACDAVVRLQSREGTEELPLSDFYLGYKVMRRSPVQLLTEIRVPRRSYDFQMFEKVGSRTAQAITKVGVAVTRRGEEWRVVANSVAPTVCRCPTMEAFLASGQPVGGPEDLARPIREDVSPIDDIRSTARYRETVLARLLYFGLRDECPSFT
ncbi:MAG: FAD binding domain-containing protein [bacterium]